MDWGVAKNDIKKPGVAKNEAGRMVGRVFSRIYKAPASCGKSARLANIPKRPLLLTRRA